MSTVLLTGCATGFGRAAALRLIGAGHHVIATDPHPEALADLAGPRTLVLPLDLRDDTSVRAAVDGALAWRPVDALVNNGGFAVFATQEEGDIEAMRTMFDVNVFGQARVTRALLPTLRERSGTVVQIASVAGRTVFPESGWYAASKHALEALSEALFLECCSFGVKVRVIEPGSFDTQFLPTARAHSPDPGPGSPYAALRDLWTRRKLALLEPPGRPEQVAAAIERALADPRPFYREAVGADAERMLTLREELGADGYAQLAGRRNSPGTSSAIARVLSGGASDADRLAARRGHLDHWAESAEGAEALARLLS